MVSMDAQATPFPVEEGSGGARGPPGALNPVCKLSVATEHYSGKVRFPQSNRSFTFLVSPTMSASPVIAPETDKSAYIGDEWFLYASRGPGDYNLSEMMAPAVLLAPPGTQYDIVLRETTLSAPAFLHSSPTESAGAGPGLVLLYLDPLSAEGRAIQRRCQGSVVPWPVPTRIYDAVSFDALASMKWSAADVCAFTQRWRATIRQALPEEPPVDEKLKRAAHFVATHLDTRLNLAEVGQFADLRPDALRERFGRVSGMTLSRYQMWKRLHGMIAAACAVTRSAADVSAPLNAVMLDAGFYDAAHGSRAVSQYFGIASPLSAGLAMRFCDCRQATHR